MKIEVDIKEYLPQFLHKIPEYQKLADTDNAELDTLWDGLDELEKNQYIETLNEDGLKRYEEYLGITPKASATIEERRFTIKSRWNSNEIYNYAYLVKSLDAMVGKGGYTIDFQDSYLTIKIALGNKSMFNDVVKFIDNIIPCGIVTTVIVLYNTHEMLKRYLHEELHEYTHTYLREEELPEFNYQSVLSAFEHDELSGFKQKEIRQEEMS